MEAPGRRVIEEQEPSGSITLQCLGERSHTPTEWRLSDCGCMIKKKGSAGLWLSRLKFTYIQLEL